MDGIVEGDEMEQYLNVTLDETKRLTDMVNELIDMSQLDKNNLKLNIKEADIKDIILQVIKQMKLKALEKNQSLDIEVSDDLIGKIDSNRFRQVLINIIAKGQNLLSKFEKESKSTLTFRILMRIF